VRVRTVERPLCIVCAQTLNLNRKVKTTEYTVEDLEPDVEYEFRVSAENSVGTSEPTVSSPVKYGPSVVQLYFSLPVQ